mmetsp:Transcript_2908/g.4020  ORF Transcript_2908/g.4020 Transcript_2908/m.4020 type:complete len:115 (+) Transcript_2908:97-441(+)
MMNGEDILDSKGERVFFSREAMMHNNKSIDLVRTFLTLIGGCCAGILGYTGFNGAVLYVCLYFMMQLSFLVLMGFDSTKYTTVPPAKFLFLGIESYGLSYILFWTLTYALIYIY